MTDDTGKQDTAKTAVKASMKQLNADLESAQEAGLDVLVRVEPKETSAGPLAQVIVNLERVTRERVL